MISFPEKLDIDISENTMVMNTSLPDISANANYTLSSSNVKFESEEK
jgi:hypothetical protein